MDKHLYIIKMRFLASLEMTALLPFLVGESRLRRLSPTHHTDETVSFRAKREISKKLFKNDLDKNRQLISALQ
jgi:hypothetical protein